MKASSQEVSPTLSATDAERLEPYRSLCGSAVLALLFGLLSVVALAHPAAWIVPLLAVVCGLWSLRRIVRQPDALIGTSLAVTGLSLGLFFLAWAPTSYVTDRWLVTRQARQFCEQWLTAVFDGDLSSAYQAALAVRERQPQGTALDEFYENNEAERVERDGYFQDGLPKQLADLRGSGRFEFDRSLGTTFDRTYTLVAPRFWVYRDGHDQPVLHLQMEVIRESDEDGVYWTLIKMADADVVDREVRARAARHQPAVR